MSEEFWDTIEADIHQTHIIVNAEAGHGKTSFVKSIIQELKERDPRLIVKCFDVSFAWFNNAPLKYRQHITLEAWANIHNQDDCVYEMGDLSEDTRRLFVSLIVKQDYAVRRKIREMYGEEELKKMPFIIYVFEESDTFFDSASLNKKDDASATLRDFIKVGRNFGLRGICVVTANTGELGTKLRRRSKYLIGRIISDEDTRELNRKRKGLGKAALELQRFNWLYYNGKKLLGPITIPLITFGSPKENIETKNMADLKISLQEDKDIPNKTVSRWYWVMLGFLGTIILGFVAYLILECMMTL